MTGSTISTYVAWEDLKIIRGLMDEEGKTMSGVLREALELWVEARRSVVRAKVQGLLVPEAEVEPHVLDRALMLGWRRVHSRGVDYILSPEAGE